MSKRVFITTNWDSLRSSVLPEAAPGRNGNKCIDQLSNDTKVLYYNNPDFGLNNQNNSACIILIHDMSYEDVIVNIDIKHDDYLLHHTRPNNPTPKYEEKFGTNKTNGKHQLHDSKYPLVFKIIFDDEIQYQDKAEEIIKAIFYDPEEEKLTEAIFAAIYDKKSEQEIEVVIKERDNHVNDKLNKK